MSAAFRDGRRFARSGAPPRPCRADRAELRTIERLSIRRDCHAAIIPKAPVPFSMSGVAGLPKFVGEDALVGKG